MTSLFMQLTVLQINHMTPLHSVEPEIATPPLNGLILPGVVRKSLIQLMREWVCVRPPSLNEDYL